MERNVTSVLNLTEAQQENKSIDYLCKDMVEEVRFLNLPHLLHV